VHVAGITVVYLDEYLAGEKYQHDGHVDEEAIGAYAEQLFNAAGRTISLFYFLCPEVMFAVTLVPDNVKLCLEFQIQH